MRKKSRGVPAENLAPPSPFTPSPWVWTDPAGGPELEAPPSLIDGLQDGPRRASKAAKRIPREPRERPKSARREAQESPRGLQHVLKTAL